MAKASAAVSLSDRDISDIAAVVATEADPNDTPEAYQATIEAVVDTVMNRMSSPDFPDTVRGVLNENRAFSKITGPARLSPHGSVQATPRAPAQVAQAVQAHVTERTRGKPSTIGTSVNYANPTFSDKKNIDGWISPMIAAGATAIGTGQRQQHFGTAPGNVPGMSSTPSFSPAGPAIDSEYQSARAGTMESGPLGMPTPTSRQSGILSARSPMSRAQMAGTPADTLGTPQAGILSGIAPTPMSRAQNMDTPADPLGTPSNRMGGVLGITRGPTAPQAATGVLDAPTGLPDFNAIPSGVLEGYQQHARSRQSGLMPEVAAPPPMRAPVATPVAPRQETKIAGVLSNIGRAIEKSSILGGVKGVADRLGGVLEGIGPGDIEGSVLDGGNIMSNVDVFGAASAAMRGTPTAHTAPNGQTNYSGKSHVRGGNGAYMDAVTNPAGVTTISDDNHSMIDRSKGASPGAPGGPTVLCTYYHSLGWIPDDVYESDQAYGKTVSIDLLQSYHRWAIPLAGMLPHHKWLELAVWPFVSLWARSMHQPDKWWSKAVRWSGESLCNLTAPNKRAQNV